MRCLIILTATVLILSNISSFAAGPRKISFNSVATNRLTVGINQAVSSTCTISVFNGSDAEQEFTMTVRALATGDHSGPASLASHSKNPEIITKLEAKTGSQTFTYEYPKIPAQSKGTQTLICSGSITVSASKESGFINAAGTVTTFQESSRMTDQNDAGKNLQIRSGRDGIYHSQSFLINDGKPF